ncbi:MAG: hypothetical protein INQ03_18495 [Candidatus Heimdallarchaeota archaeon]|nr:hypothetical protein [Candidatus Heimdallarchaeota archaeon]
MEEYTSIEYIRLPFSNQNILIPFYTTITRLVMCSNEERKQLILETTIKTLLMVLSESFTRNELLFLIKKLEKEGTMPRVYI